MMKKILTNLFILSLLWNSCQTKIDLEIEDVEPFVVVDGLLRYYTDSEWEELSKLIDAYEKVPTHFQTRGTQTIWVNLSTSVYASNREVFLADTDKVYVKSYDAEGKFAQRYDFEKSEEETVYKNENESTTALLQNSLYVHKNLEIDPNFSYELHIEATVEGKKRRYVSSREKVASNPGIHSLLQYDAELEDFDGSTDISRFITPVVKNIQPTDYLLYNDYYGTGNQFLPAEFNGFLPGTNRTKIFRGDLSRGFHCGALRYGGVSDEDKYNDEAKLGDTIAVEQVGIPKSRYDHYFNYYGSINSRDQDLPKGPVKGNILLADEQGRAVEDNIRYGLGFFSVGKVSVKYKKVEEKGLSKAEIQNRCRQLENE